MLSLKICRGLIEHYIDQIQISKMSLLIVNATVLVFTNFLLEKTCTTQYILPHGAV